MTLQLAYSYPWIWVKMIFPLEITASGEKFASCIVSSEEYYCLNFVIYCVCWCYFYTVKQQPCRRINNLIKKNVMEDFPGGTVDNNLLPG